MHAHFECHFNQVIAYKKKKKKKKNHILISVTCVTCVILLDLVALSSKHCDST